MIARILERKSENHPRSLTHSITTRHPASLTAEEQFRIALDNTGKALWMGVLKEMGALSRTSHYQARQVDVYVSMKNDQEIPLEEVAATFQSFASTLRPHRVALHLVPNSEATPEDLRENLRDPRKHLQSTMIWEERLTRDV